jgi:predicted nucleotidyltransferase component of viral defense system
MIPRPDIVKWKQYAPWNEFAQVEQDLIISRAMVEIFSDEFLRENLAFRGGTALHKLYLNPAPRHLVTQLPIHPFTQSPNSQSFDQKNRIISKLIQKSD